MHFYKKFTSYILYKKLAKESENKRKSQKPAFQDLRTIGILINLDVDQDQRGINNWIKELKEMGKQVQVLCYASNGKIFSNGNIQLKPKDLDWLGRPKKNLISDAWINRKWDAIFKIYPGDCPALDYIIASCEAKIKTGFITQRHYLLDIIVDNGSKSLTDNLSQLMHLLYTVKSKSYEPVL